MSSVGSYWLPMSEADKLRSSLKYAAPSGFMESFRGYWGARNTPDVHLFLLLSFSLPISLSLAIWDFGLEVRCIDRSYGANDLYIFTHSLLGDYGVVPPHPPLSYARPHDWELGPFSWSSQCLLPRVSCYE